MQCVCLSFSIQLVSFVHMLPAFWLFALYDANLSVSCVYECLDCCPVTIVRLGFDFVFGMCVCACRV